MPASQHLTCHAEQYVVAEFCWPTLLKVQALKQGEAQMLSRLDEHIAHMRRKQVCLLAYLGHNIVQ